MLIAAASGRALAASARRGGYAPLVADFFGDQDTVAAAHAHVRLEAGSVLSIDTQELLTAFGILAAPHQPAGAVCGTGFEDRPELLARIAKHWTLLGNKPETVARVKDPLAFADICRNCGIPHPETALTPPADPTGWLRKRKGGAGGWHIGAADDHRTPDTGFYFQRRVQGTAVSALVLADGHRAMILGYSLQWSSPTLRHPFRYGGAARPAALAPEIASRMTRAVQRLISAVPIVGLNSIDFLVDGNEFQLLEINPRPGATLDIFEPRDGSLFGLHVAACEGRLPPPPTYDEAAASAIVYANDDIPSFPGMEWPSWTADRPCVGASIKAGGPLCTALAFASTAAAAKALVERRIAIILADLGTRVS
ncbi:MAG TPA: ATP-grasp domain-containing protein [Xanthobacteraceae bacterium]